MIATLSMSLPPERVRRFSPGPKVIWTLVGAAAIPLWATWPLLAVLSTGTMPLFQFLTIIFAVGAVALFVLRRSGSAVQPEPERRGTWLTKWFQAGMVAVGLLVSDIFFVEALHYIPAAQANLILYLWPAHGSAPRSTSWSACSARPGSRFGGDRNVRGGAGHCTRYERVLLGRNRSCRGGGIGLGHILRFQAVAGTGCTDRARERVRAFRGHLPATAPGQGDHGESSANGAPQCCTRWSRSAGAGQLGLGPWHPPRQSCPLGRSRLRDTSCRRAHLDSVRFCRRDSGAFVRRRPDRCWRVYLLALAPVVRLRRHAACSDRHPCCGGAAGAAGVPALPGCISQGDTMDDLLANMREAIAAWMEAELPETPMATAGQVVELTV